MTIHIGGKNPEKTAGGEADGDPLQRPSRRRIVLGFAGLGGGATAGVALVIGFAVIFVRLSWPHVEPAGNPIFGINYSCNHAEYLLLEDPARGSDGFVSDDRPGRAEWCAATLAELLQGLGARYVRISVEWSQVEPLEGVYDFRLVDALLAEAGRHDAKVLLTVGVKGQRHPEFYIPEWVRTRVDLREREVISDDAFLRSSALAMVEAVVRHVASSTAIDSWGADNEPFVPSLRAENWVLGRDFVEEEVARIRANDTGHRPVSVNHAQHFVFDRRWQDALVEGDILGASLYPFRNYEVAGLHFVVPILEIGPLAPNYAHQAREAKALGREYWLTEMQAEPWPDGDARLTSPNHPAPDVTAANFRKNIDYARRTGAERVYLWGAEWWLYQREHFGDRTWWNLAREAILGPD